MNEFDIIKSCFSPLAVKEGGAFGLNDDAAVITVPDGMELVITKDAISEGVHFIGNETPGMIAQKLLRTNLSDLAAMGAKPYAYFLALMLPNKIDEHWIQLFSEGLRADQERFGITLMGGDTTCTLGTLSMSATALGLVTRGKALRRSGAKVGDNVYVSGTIGDAALGLRVASGQRPVTSIKQSTDHYFLQRYQLPTPRVELGQALVDIATSCMDISDGLMQDAGHIAECSGVSAIIEWEKIPLSDAAKAALPQLERPQEMIAAGGDDYELLFTAPAKFQEKLQEFARKVGTSISLIGTIKAGNGTKMIDKEGNEIYLSRIGYNHFNNIK